MFKLQTTLVVRGFAIRGFISVLWWTLIFYSRPNFKAYYLRRTFSRLISECDADDKLSTNEFWRQFKIKMADVNVSSFLRFKYLYAAIGRNATPVYNESSVFTKITDTASFIIPSAHYLYDVTACTRHSAFSSEMYVLHWIFLCLRRSHNLATETDVTFVIIWYRHVE
jgi:hypothetical protein